MSQKNHFCIMPPAKSITLMDTLRTLIKSNYIFMHYMKNLYRIGPIKLGETTP